MCPEPCESHLRVSWVIFVSPTSRATFVRVVQRMGNTVFHTVSQCHEASKLEWPFFVEKKTKSWSSCKVLHGLPAIRRDGCFIPGAFVH